MNAQSIIALALVATALAYVGRRAWKTMAAARAKKAAGCGPDCGCH